MALDRDRIQKDGIKLLDEFSRMLSDVKETTETHYVVDLKNVMREDKEPVETKGFRDKLKKNAPNWEDNHVIAEKGA